MDIHALGALGEEKAVCYLKEKGHQIVKTNYRYLKSEVDIISIDGQDLVFTEVKTRQTAEIGEPWMAVTKKKQKQIIKCAHQYVVAKDLDVNVRFDIVSIVHNSYGTRLEHIPCAFTA
ncbi:MAG: YraN family protein [Crocinitomicaceae bacterium]|nr:YraN family protein [Crocinitomicaceae bacterium]